MYRFCLLSLLLLGLPALPIAGATPDYLEDVRPILEQHCFKCHGPDKQKGKVRLDTLPTDLIKDRRAAETWHDALDSLNLGEMPPEDEPGLSSEERSTLTSWIDHQLELAHQANTGKTNTIVMRRLNRAEYNHTMRDLLDLDIAFSDSLPSDSYSTDGFLNNGAALKMSGMQLETYLKTAREAMQFALVEGAQPKREVKPLNDKFKARGKLPPGQPGARLGRNHYWSGSIDRMPRTGPFTIRITARAEKSSDLPNPVLNVEYGYFVSGLTTTFRKAIGQITIDSSESKTYECKGRSEFYPQPDARVPADKLNGVVLLYNGFKDGTKPPKPTKTVIKPEDDPKSKRKKKAKTILNYPEDPSFPQIVIEKVEFVQNDYPSWPPSSHTRITGDQTDLSSRQSIETIIEGFFRNAWRRPASETEIEKWLAHYDTLLDNMDSPTQALRELLALALTSNHFLYLQEPETDQSRPLSHHELASRLSYFLWSSMPDDELSKAADQGTLNLSSEFDRMINDPKSERFVDQFVTQWLDLGAPDRVAINPQYYDDFDESLKPLMVKETREYFDYILRNNHSALQFLKSDYTMLNKQLAQHYGIPGSLGAGFEKVSLKESDRRGGLLGHASMHMAGSDGAHSNPIKRAVWIRERLLHDPPKPPPPNVPSVEESVPNFDKLTVREQMEIHRKKEACADCHRGIDPWGIAMEQYDAIGLKREKIAKTRKPVDAVTTLPGGFEVAGLDGLQNYLLEKRSDQFAHSLVSKMMIYALGRSLELSDEPLIEAITESFKENGYQIKPMMKQIVTSSAFANR